MLEEGSCVLRVTSASGENRYDRIVRMIEASERLKSSVESLADRLVPWCLGASALTFLLTRNIARAVSVLMVDFSCALKLSMPLSVLSAMREEQAAGRKVIMIGDGINDTPALSLADVGIAVGTGASIAREVADITIAAEDLRELVYLKMLSDRLMKRINRNYRFVMLFNGLLIALGAFGFLPPAASAILHNSSTLLLSLNCMTELLGGEDQINERMLPS